MAVSIVSVSPSGGIQSRVALSLGEQKSRSQSLENHFDRSFSSLPGDRFAALEKPVQDIVKKHLFVQPAFYYDDPFDPHPDVSYWKQSVTVESLEASLSKKIGDRGDQEYKKFISVSSAVVSKYDLENDFEKARIEALRCGVYFRQFTRKAGDKLAIFRGVFDNSSISMMEHLHSVFEPRSIDKLATDELIKHFDLALLTDGLFRDRFIGFLKLNVADPLAKMLLARFNPTPAYVPPSGNSVLPASSTATETKQPVTLAGNATPLKMTPTGPLPLVLVQAKGVAVDPTPKAEPKAEKTGSGSANGNSGANEQESPAELGEEPAVINWFLDVKTTTLANPVDQPVAPGGIDEEERRRQAALSGASSVK